MIPTPSSMLVAPHSAAIAATAALTRQTARSAEHVSVSSHLFIAFLDVSRSPSPLSLQCTNDFASIAQTHSRRIAVYPIYDVIARDSRTLCCLSNMSLSFARTLTAFPPLPNPPIVLPYVYRHPRAFTLSAQLLLSRRHPNRPTSFPFFNIGRDVWWTRELYPPCPGLVRSPRESERGCEMSGVLWSSEVMIAILHYHFRTWWMDGSGKARS